MEVSQYFVYVLRNAEGRLYIGSTNNLERRVKQHQADRRGWTHNRGPWELVYQETFNERLEARHRERYLKTSGNYRLRKQLGEADE